VENVSNRKVAWYKRINNFIEVKRFAGSSCLHTSLNVIIREHCSLFYQNEKQPY